MIKKIEGIVISTVDYKESSKIINVFTKSDGIIGLVARGSKRANSKIAVGSNTLSYGYFYINAKNPNFLANLNEVEIINNFNSIRKDIIKLNYAIYLLELSSEVYKHDNNSNIYNLLISSLIKINEGYDSRVITNILELKLLDFLGIRPVINHCVNCKNNKDIVTISSYKGGYLCKKCVSNEKIFNIKTIKLIRMFFYVDIGKITKLDISDNIKDEIGMFIDEYYDRYSGLYLKSKTFLNEFSKT